MIIDFTDGFETESLSVDDKIGFFSGDIVPDETIVVNAPIGSRYFQTNQDWYLKVGVGDTAPNWEKIDQTTLGANCQLHFLRLENCGRELIWESIPAASAGSYDTDDFKDCFMTCTDTTLTYVNCELIFTT